MSRENKGVTAFPYNRKTTEQTNKFSFEKNYKFLLTFCIKYDIFIISIAVIFAVK